MIQLKINHMDHKAILTVPTEYERVTLALWTIGLDRDPEKYTLRQLDAEFTYTTEEESQMVQLIDSRSSLMNALCFLSEMVYPPYPVAERIHKKMAAGGYASEDDFFIEMEKLVYDQNLDMHVFYFPKLCIGQHIRLGYIGVVIVVAVPAHWWTLRKAVLIHPLNGAVETNDCLDAKIAEYIRTKYTFHPSMEFVWEKLDPEQLITWPELLDIIPKLIAEQVRIICG